MRIPPQILVIFVTQNVQLVMEELIVTANLVLDPDTSKEPLVQQAVQLVNMERDQQTHVMPVMQPVQHVTEHQTTNVSHVQEQNI